MVEVLVNTVEASPQRVMMGSNLTSLWLQSKIPSQRCLLVTLSYLGYRGQIKKLLY